MLRLCLALWGMAVGLVLLLPFILLAAPFLLVSGMTRLIRAWIEPEAAPWQSVVGFHSELGWKPKPNLDTVCSFPAGIFKLQTGPDGWPGQMALDECDMVVIGDSYAFGYGVNTEDAYFSVSRKVKVKAIGSPGYSMVHAVEWMRRLAPQLSGKLVVWLPCYSNDLYDNLLPNLYHYRTPFARRQRNGTWEICNGHVRPEPWPFNYEKNVRFDEKFHAVFGENALSNRAYQASRFLIQEAHKICTDAGAGLAIMTVPWPVQIDDGEWVKKCERHGGVANFDRNAPDRNIGATCERLGISFIAGSCWLQPEHHIPGEGHWNEKGHREVAKLLEQMFEEWSRIRRARQPLVTFGVPVYNGARHLAEGLRSLLDQTYRNIEVVICDNASTDGTQGICERFAAADSRVRYFRNDRNIGQFPNFNRTLSLARGDYFAWACADDIRPPEVVEECVAALQRNPKAVAAHGAVMVQPRGTSETTVFSNRVDLAVDDAAERVRRFTHDIASNAMVYSLYRIDALRSAVFGDHLAQDYLLSLQMCMLGPLEYVDVPLVLYRERRLMPIKNRMYAEVALSGGRLLKEGPARRRKCWTTLLLGSWYGLRLSGVPVSQKLRAVGAHIRHFSALHASRMGKELVFVAFEPAARLLFVAWSLLRGHRWAGRMAERVRAIAPSLAPRKAA